MPQPHVRRSYHDRRWDECHAACVEFLRLYGHLRVADQKLRINGVAPAPWLARQRQLWRQGLLRPDRRRRLEELGVDPNPLNVPLPPWKPPVPAREPLPVAEMAAKYTSGATLDQLAALYRVARSTVKSALLGAGVMLRPRGSPPRPPEDQPLPVDDMIARYLAGAHAADLAAEYKVEPYVIYGYLKRRKVPRRDDRHTPHPRAGGHRRKPLPVAEMAAAYEAGASLGELTRRYPATAATISKRLQEHGVVLRRRPGWPRP